MTSSYYRKKKKKTTTTTTTKTKNKNKKKQNLREKLKTQEFPLFIFITLHEGKRIRFVDSSDSDIKKLVSSAGPKSTKFAANVRHKIECEGHKVDKPLSGLLVYRLIMSFVERLLSKFHISQTISQPRKLLADTIAA